MTPLAAVITLLTGAMMPFQALTTRSFLPSSSEASSLLMSTKARSRRAVASSAPGRKSSFPWVMPATVCHASLGKASFWKTTCSWLQFPAWIRGQTSKTISSAVRCRFRAKRCRDLSRSLGTSARAGTGFVTSWPAPSTPPPDITSHLRPTAPPRPAAGPRKQDERNRRGVLPSAHQRAAHESTDSEAMPPRCRRLSLAKGTVAAIWTRRGAAA
mmetsp:Transcript_40183/g.90697  ORF Transcript_40183/g.90697 Transcript_40183/m.90697 type:complete len:214 (+) Transcript_40183:111-752(+)